MRHVTADPQPTALDGFAATPSTKKFASYAPRRADRRRVSVGPPRDRRTVNSITSTRSLTNDHLVNSLGTWRKTMQTGTYARHRFVTSALVLLGIALLWLALGGTAFAEDAGPPACGGKILEKCTPNSGDTAWMLTSVALVLMMTVPGLGLFYGGMVRKKNVGDTVM